MFSKGQWIFAACFFVAFLIGMVIAYRKDKGLHKVFYKGNYKVLLGFLAFIALLFVIKIVTKR